MTLGRDALVDDVISAKWCVPILRVLLSRPARFSRLRHALPLISANILAARLRFLEDARIVERTRLPEPADCQVYRLTSKGQHVRLLIDALNQLSAAWEQDEAIASETPQGPFTDKELGQA